MTPAHDMTPEHDDDILAAEYVLGVLPVEERRAAAGRAQDEPAFAALVEAWEDRFSPFQTAYTPTPPPDWVKAALDRRLFERQGESRDISPGLLQSLGFWRFLTAGSLAALAFVVALPLLRPLPDPVPAENLVASLASEESDVGYLVVYDRQSGEIALSHLSGAAGPAEDFELWLIAGNAPPVSVGVIPDGQTARVPLAPEHREQLAPGLLFAISREPEGGSPTDAPTGPVVAAGELRGI